MMHNKLVVEPEELLAEIEKLSVEKDDEERDLCIVDLSAQSNYLAGHVPGAVFLPFQALISGQAPAPGKIAPLKQLEEVFSYLGLNKNTHFIAYDDEGGGWAGRFIWTLDAIGHPNYSYLNGGLKAWQQAKLPLEQEENQRVSSQARLSLNPEVLVELSDILVELEKDHCQIWDARSPQEYSGEVQSAAKSGHIPGAINCEWTNMMDPAQGYRIRADSKDVLLSLGFTNDKPIITHCQSHHRSGFTYLVGKSLNFDIRAYHGSWSEWGNHPETPVER